MTDDRSQMEDRLGDWFEAELRRAEVDLATPVRAVVVQEPVRATTPRRLASARAGIALSMLVALIGITTILTAQYAPPPAGPRTPGVPVASAPLVTPRSSA